MSEKDNIELTSEDLEDLFLESRLSKELDRLYEYATSKKHDFAPWMPVTGLPGSGKTSIIQSWLKHKKVNYWYISGIRGLSKIEVEYYKDAPREPEIRLVSNEELIDLLTPKKKKVNVLFASDEIDAVDDQTVIVIDDYDRASEEVRAELFKLIAFHQVVDPRANNENKIKIINPLMLVVVIDSMNTDVLNEDEKKLFLIN